ncbi:MAG: hypothetical protein JWM43_1540 [Acidobacteriaceae bacterium]|nr:hypothetical protein [Acidobacteriaceae bacterium]
MVRAGVSQLLQLALLSGIGLAQQSLGFAQQPIGSVGVQDATVAGALEVTNGRAVLVGNTTVTAKDHTAEVTLGRGGKVLVCATSGLHLTAGKAASGAQPLLLSLDRGAVEVQMAATASDVVMTPDLRFAIQSAGPLDLKLRVTRYGDTCVENVGANAPLLRISDQFGDTTYELHAGQHVLFEHANLKEVVDRETSPCGCPPEPVVSVADAGVTSATPAAPGSVVAAKQTAEQHPFPAAVSQGLAPSNGPPPTQAGAIHTQVAATLTFNAADAEKKDPATTPAAAAASTSSIAAGSSTGASAGSQPAPPTAATTVRAEAPLPPAPPSGTDIAHRIGRFFKRLFGKG